MAKSKKPTSSSGDEGAGHAAPQTYQGRAIDPKTNHPRARWGKTQKDRAGGAARRNADNKEARVSWQHDNKASISNFPYASCNGKRNRTLVTGRQGKPVFTMYK